MKLRVIKLFFVFNYLTFNGLAQQLELTFDDRINSVTTDSSGFIFLISNNHICKFDGKELHNCQNFPFQISHSKIISEHHLFIASDNVLYQVLNQKYQKLVTLPENITKIELFDNQLILGTSGKGCYIYDFKSKKLTLLQASENQFVNDILIQNNFVYVLLDNAILKYETTHWKTVLQQSFGNLIFSAFQTYQQNKLVVFTSDGDIFILTDRLQTVLKKKFSQFTIEKMATFQDNVLIITSKGSYKLNTQLNITEEIKENISQILPYKQQVFASFEKNLFKIDFLQKSIPTKNNYSLFAQDSTVWVGGEGKITQLKNQRVTKTINLPKPFQKSIVSAITVVDGNIWAGTMGNGIFIFDQNAHLIKRILHNGSDNEKNIIQLKAEFGLVWVGYLNGVMQLNPKNFSALINYDKLLKNSYLYTFLPINKNEFYIGTSDSGICHFHNEKVDYHFEGMSVFSITKSEDYLVASIENKGIALIKDFKTQWLNTTSGLRTNTIYNNRIFDDFLILSHEQGIDIYNLKTKRFNYINSPYHSENQLNAMISNDTDLYIGYVDGILQLDQSLLHFIDFDRLILNQPKLFETKIAENQHLFKHNQNVFSFSFESVEYYVPKEVFYKYRLKGLDESWKITTQEYVNFYNLKPGKYTFEIATGNIRNFVPNQIKSYFFEIKKPFWKTWWFWSLISFLSILLIISGIKWRENQIILQENIKTAKLQFEFEQLKNQINPHFLFNSFNSLIGIIEENPQNAIKVVEKLSLLFRNFLKYENVDTISVAEELEMALQYFEIHKIRYQNLINLNINNIQNADNKRVIPMSGQLLIENAIKHNVINKAHQLNINIYEEPHFLVFENNINPKTNVPTSGFGLQNLIKRNELIIGQQPIIEHHNTHFIVKIPVIND